MISITSFKIMEPSELEKVLQKDFAKIFLHQESKVVETLTR